jgi:hypothetical protein
MEEQQRLPALHINHSHGVNHEGFAVGTAEQTSVDSPSRTIAFDDDYTPLWHLPIDQFVSGEGLLKWKLCIVLSSKSVMRRKVTRLSRLRCRTTRLLVMLIRTVASSIMDHVILALPQMKKPRL